MLAAGDAHADEPGVAQDAQVLRDRGLRDAERGEQLVHGALTVAGQLEDAPPRRIGERLVDVGPVRAHGRIIY